jgi:hypothetical protein
MFHCNAEIVLGFFLWMDGIHENPKVTNFRMVGNHERLWTSKVQILLFFPTFGCFCLLAVYMFLMVCYYGSNATNLGLLMELLMVCYYGSNATNLGLLMERVPC